MDIEVSQHENFVVISVSGEVDFFCSPKLRQVITAQLGQGHNIALELSHVSYIDTSAVAILIEGLQTANKYERNFTLVSTSQAVLQVLQLARLDRVIPLVDSIAELPS